MLLRRLLGSEIELRIEIASGTPAIWFERSQFDQVVLNLASNARDAMPGLGRLTISARNETIRTDDPAGVPRLEPGEYVRIDVTDTGAGMSPEVASRIFEPFFTTKAEGLGTGLGLAVVYGAVTQHGGAVWVDSQPGFGTSFHLLLRQPPREDSASRGTAENPARIDGTGTRVLIVDDDASVRLVATRLLRAQGYDTVEAEDGAQALPLLDAPGASVQAVVTDLVMPVMGGADLARLLVERTPALGIVIASGYPDAMGNVEPAVLERCVVLQKPYDATALASAIQSSIELAKEQMADGRW